MKIVLIVLVLLVAVTVTGALLAGPQLRDKLASLKPKPPTTAVRIEKARVGTLVETVSAPGEIEPHTRVNIAAVVSARVLELPFRAGDLVRKGDVIGQLDDRDLQTLLSSARARHEGEQARLRSEARRKLGAEGNLDFAEKELDRMQKLYASGDVSRRDLDSAQERFDDLRTSADTLTHSISMIESSLAAAQADINRAQEGINNTVIVSPIDGVITWLGVEVGEIVTGSTTNPGTVVMTIADLSRMVLKAQVAESDIAEVKVGQKAKIFINAYPDEIYSGTVRHIALQRSGSADGTGYFETEVEIDLRGGQIYSGLVANVDIEIATHEGVVVPYQAIVTRTTDELPEALRDDPLVDKAKKKTHVVYRVVEGKAVCTPVEAGKSDLTHRLVSEGVAEGDEIITGPYKALESIKHDEAVSNADEKTAGDAAPADKDSSEGDSSEEDASEEDASERDSSEEDASEEDASERDSSEEDAASADPGEDA